MPNARGEPRQQPQRRRSEGWWRRLHCVVGLGSAKDTAPPPLFPNPDAMDFDHEELAGILLHGGMRGEVLGEAIHKLRNNFWMIVHLQGNNAAILAWGIVTIFAKSPFKDTKMASSC